MVTPRAGLGSNQYQTLAGSAPAARSAASAAVLNAVTEDDSQPLPQVTAGPCPVTWDGEKWTKRRCSHSECRDALRQVRAMTGPPPKLDPEEAAAWVNAGLGIRRLVDRWKRSGFTPETAAPWVAIGAEPYDIQRAHTSGLTAADVKPWLEAVGKWSTATGYIDKEFTLEEASRWYQAGAFGHVADAARTLGYTPTAYADFCRRSGIGGTGDRMYYGWQVQSYLHHLDPEVAKQWHATGIDPHKQKDWDPAKWSPDEAAGWAHLGVNAEDAENLREAGVTAADVAALGDVVKSVNKAGTTGGSQVRVRDWVDVMKLVGIDETRRWADLNMDSAVTLGAVRWGVTADEMGALRREGSRTEQVGDFAVTARWANGRTRWTVTGPDGVDMEAEKVAAAFTATVPEWESAKTRAQRLTKYTATPGEALRWATRTSEIKNSGWLRQRLKEVPLADLDPEFNNDSNQDIYKIRLNVSPAMLRQHAEQAMRSMVADQ